MQSICNTDVYSAERVWRKDKEDERKEHLGGQNSESLIKRRICNLHYQMLCADIKHSCTTLGNDFEVGKQAALLQCLHRLEGRSSVQVHSAFQTTASESQAAFLATEKSFTIRKLF